MATLAEEKDRDLMVRAWREGAALTMAEARTLRRAQLTLHRWAEEVCGSSGPYASWAIERDEVDGKPWRYIHPHRVEHGRTYRYRVPDRERGALRRVAAVCDRLGLDYYHQGDPRGCSLYITGQRWVVEQLCDYDFSIACV